MLEPKLGGVWRRRKGCVAFRARFGGCREDRGNLPQIGCALADVADGEAEHLHWPHELEKVGVDQHERTDRQPARDHIASRDHQDRAQRRPEDQGDGDAVLQPAARESRPELLGLAQQMIVAAGEPMFGCVGFDRLHIHEPIRCETAGVNLRFRNALDRTAHAGDPDGKDAAISSEREEQHRSQRDAQHGGQDDAGNDHLNDHRSHRQDQMGQDQSQTQHPLGEGLGERA